MSHALPRVVLDTVVFVQTLISGGGPSAACLKMLRAGRFVLLISDAGLAELNDVPLRPKFTAKYPYVTAEKVAAFVSEVKALAVGCGRLLWQQVAIVVQPFQAARAGWKACTTKARPVPQKMATPLAVRIPNPPHAFTLTRDPGDEPFIDLAVTGDAQFIVTWNERHLTYLMKRNTPEGQDFCSRFPGIRILSPPEFLAVIEPKSA